MALVPRSARLRLFTAATAAAVGLTATGGAAFAASGANSKSNQPTINEAVISAFTGPESFVGGVNLAGAYPAAWAINHAGGVLGHQFGVVSVDTRGDPADALPLVERFLGSTSNIAGISGTDGATINQLVPLFNAHKVTITSIAGSSRFDRTKFQYFWRLTPPDVANGLGMALWAKKRGFKRIALVFGTDSTAQTDLPGILYGAKQAHLQIVANIGLSPDQPSYQADVASVLAAKPQAILTEEDNTTAATFFGDLKQLGSVPNIIGTSGTLELSWVSAVATALGTSTFASKFSAVTIQSVKPTPAAAAFKTALLNTKSKVENPVSQWFNEPYAEAAYDGVIIQALAMLAAHSVKPSSYNSFIPSVTTPGAGKVKVYSYAEGKAALAKGKHIQYIGVSGPALFNQYHNSYGNQVAVTFPTASMANEHVQYTIPGKLLEAAG